MHPKYWKFPGAAYREQATDGTTGSAGGGSLDAFSAASAFESRLSDEPDDQAATAPAADASPESDEQAAERLAAEEAGIDPAAGETDPKPESFTIKVDGKDMVLTADEMAEHVKNGMRQADYSRKTAEAAEQRKTADAEIAQARSQRDEYANKLGTFANQATYELNALAAQLTEDLLQSDPVTYLSTQRTLQARHAELQQAQQELQQINSQRESEQADAHRQHLATQQELLLAKLPEWRDPAKAKAESTQIKEYLLSQGLAPEEAEFTDHRAVLMARKAMQFDALMERARATSKKVAAAPPKVERPGNADSARPGDGRTSAIKQLKHSGSVNDAAAAFSQFL